MFNFPAITWIFTIILILIGTYHLVQAIWSHQVTSRINNLLHALMSIVMAGMLWNLAPSTTLAQIIILSGAALWFIIQAIARPEFKTLCAGRGNRLRCIYHSLTMAGAAIMVAMMTGHAASAARGNVPATEMPVSHAHHGTASPAQPSSLAATDGSPALAILLTLFFATAAVVFMFFVVRRRSATSSKRFARVAHGLESVGAAIMALMFATMSA